MRIANCLNCNNHFKIIHKTDTFCSRECYFLFRNKPTNKNCPCCNKDYISKSLNQIYCSQSCNSYAYRNGKSKKRNSELNVIRQKKYAYKYPNKIKAQKILQYSVRRGYVIRPCYCENCLDKCNPQGHHFDYTKPLEVTWLCVKCHKMEHLCLSV